VTIAQLGEWLRSNLPPVYWVARSAWLAVRPHLRLDGYWGQRRHLEYYQEVIRLARAHVPVGSRVIDVGSHDTAVLSALDWFERRVALDLGYVARRRGIEAIVMDFMDYAPKTSFDLVLCLQVLEHLEQPAAFARKLLRTGRTVIISVPYKWPEGLVKTHRQDPVDEAKLAGWTGRTPVETRVVANGLARLVAVYRGDDILSTGGGGS
jgi:SAM-dependent methyltransferase